MKYFLLIDDDALLTSSLQANSRTIFGDAHLAVANSISAALKYRRATLEPDLIILDMVLPDVDGLEGLHKIRQSFPQSKILVFSNYEPEDIEQEFLKNGANAFLRKNCMDMNLFSKIIQQVLTGESIVIKKEQDSEITTQYTGFSNAEKEIWALRERGLSIRAIAKERNVEISTVKSQVKSINQKIKDQKDIGLVFSLKKNKRHGHTKSFAK